MNNFLDEKSRALCQQFLFLVAKRESLELNIGLLRANQNMLFGMLMPLNVKISLVFNYILIENHQIFLDIDSCLKNDLL
jgi:hypothetical protein